MTAADHIAVALDHASVDDNLDLIRRLKGRAKWLKIGMRLFFAAPERSLEAARDAGANIFLDLKLYDIPETVRGAARSLARFTPELVTIHASGGAAMATAAVEGFREGGSPSTAVIGVTILTSFDAQGLSQVGFALPPAAAALQLAEHTAAAPIAGWVCSTAEVASLRARFPEHRLIVPGIRPAGSEPGDQRRIGTPASAIQEGASLLVIGRPIIAAPDPEQAFDDILREVAAALEAP